MNHSLGGRATEKGADALSLLSVGIRQRGAQDSASANQFPTGVIGLAERTERSRPRDEDLAEQTGAQDIGPAASGEERRKPLACHGVRQVGLGLKERADSIAGGLERIIRPMLPDGMRHR